jgi:ubiquinone/menaquinone biosynthesis C-methylase UbiE
MARPTDSSTFAASDGEGYELQMGRWSRRLAPRLVDFAEVKGAVRVLDVGCGTGNLSFCLAENCEVLSIQGVDITPAYLDYARCRSRDARLNFVLGNACELPFRDASFDHALSMLTLQFIPRADRAVREMRRVTRPGGVVAAATWDTRGGMTAVRMVFDAAAIVDPDGNAARAAAYTRPLSRPGELAHAWHEAGLEAVVQDTVTIRMDFASFNDFWMPVEGKEGPVAHYVTSLNQQLRSALRERVRSAYLDGDGDGLRSYAATAWVVRGRVPAK